MKTAHWNTKDIKQSGLFWTYYIYLIIAKGRKKKCAEGRGEGKATAGGAQGRAGAQRGMAGMRLPSMSARRTCAAHKRTNTVSGDNSPKTRFLCYNIIIERNRAAKQEIKR